MSRSGIRSREENVRLYDEGVLQSLLEQSGAGGEIGGTSKKALKKLRKEEREKKKRYKTVARLEMRQEEREAKQERRERKKRDLEASLAPKVGGTSTSTSAAASTAGEDDDPGFIIDVVGETPSGDPVARKLFPDASSADDDFADEEESRYAIASPAPSTSASAAYKSRNAISDAVAKAKALEPIFVHGSDSDYSSDEGDHDDEDVWIGGATGDLLSGPKASSKEPVQKKQKQVIMLDSSSSEGSEEEEVISYLVPPKAKGGEADAKKQARAAYWAAKGKVEEGGEWDS